MKETIKDILGYIGILFYSIFLIWLFVFLENAPDYLTWITLAISILLIIFAAHKGWLEGTRYSDEIRRKYF